jgi:transcriptional regulator with XRE-family HTH domain
MSIREISRRTGLARNTVKKYLRSNEAEPTYARRVSPSKLDPYAEKLANWLGVEATQSRKQRRNLKQIYTVWPLVRVTGLHSKVENNFWEDN